MTECPVCRQQLLWPDEGAIACHMLLSHGAERVEHLSPFGTWCVEGYVFCWCGWMLSVDYPWPNASALEDAAEELAGHWATRGGVLPHYYRNLLGVEDGEEAGTV